MKLEGNENNKLVSSTEKEEQLRDEIVELFSNCPIPGSNMRSNLGLFINRQSLSRIQWLHFLYQQILEVHGVIFEFGVRWGQSMALFINFRGMYEPFNYTRKIVGFDTFEGFPEVNEKDGSASVIKKGAYNVTANYELFLEQLLTYHEQECPVPNIKKYEIVKGDAIVESEKYLKTHPETIISLAYFDLDLYEPTARCLEIIKPHLTKGAVIGFDELCMQDFPGETIAFKEVLGANNYELRRVPWNPSTSFIVIK